VTEAGNDVLPRTRANKTPSALLSAAERGTLSGLLPEL
jgi:hypothetical protein